ncbi:hypothetical protein H2248_001623 [Termitomyces sp. 'cryptogamus']|nr:hypothetical protein H2248_001623 [Termitomyces sp. 'cryptogamus']
MPVTPISPTNVFDDNNEDGWQDMPVVREDEFAGGLDEEDRKKYHYQSSATSAKATNATGNFIDVDDYGNDWRSKLDRDESNYTRLRGTEEEDADEVHLRTRYLFDEDKAMTPLSQMQATKNLLTEAQRIAYVGLCYLTCREMSQALSKASRKEFKAALSNMDLWILKIMGRLYYHMELATQEQKMIESLAEHGVLASDLVPPLMTTHTVANPEYDPVEARRQEEERDRMVHEDDTESISGQTLVDETSDQEPTTPKPSRPPSPQITHSPSKVISSTSPNSSPKAPVPYQTTARVLGDTSTTVPGVTTTLSSADRDVTLDIRWTVLCDLFLVLIADSVYDARSRVLLEAVALKLGLGWLDLVKFESRVTEALEIQEDVEKMEQKDLIEGQQKAQKRKRYVMLGLATLGGGLVIGLSAGLLAPVIGAGIGAALTTIGIGGSTGFLVGTAGAAVITTGGVLTGSGIAVHGMAKRTRLVRTFDILPLHNNKRVSCILTVPGFMAGPQDDVRLPFSVLDPVVGDVFSVLWEPEMIQETGDALKILTSEVLSQIGLTVLQATLMSALVTALQWPIILTKLGYLIDNPWSNALDRARLAGRVLADVLLHRNLGVRPITLIGFSLGARVIFYALLELAKQKAFGIVQDVFLLGATLTVSTKTWFEARSVVSGRFVNAYAKNDWVLNYLFRATSGGIGTVAGLRPIQDIPGIENVDVTDKIAGHMSYRAFMPLILDQLGFPVSADFFDDPLEYELDGERVAQHTEKKSWFSLKKKSKTPQHVTQPPLAVNQKNSQQANTRSTDNDDLPPRMEHGSPSTTEPRQDGTPTPTSPNSDNDPPIPARAGFDLKAIKAALKKVSPDELKFSSAPVEVGAKPVIDRTESAPGPKPGHRRSTNTNAVSGGLSTEREDLSARLQRAASLSATAASTSVVIHSGDSEEDKWKSRSESDKQRSTSTYDGALHVQPVSRHPTPLTPPIPFTNEPYSYSRSSPPPHPAAAAEPLKYPPRTPSETWGPPTDSSTNNFFAHTPSSPGLMSDFSFFSPSRSYSSTSTSTSPYGGVNMGSSFSFSDTGTRPDAVGLSFGGADGSIMTASGMASASPPITDPWTIPSHIGAGKRGAGASSRNGFGDNPWS